MRILFLFSFLLTSVIAVPLRRHTAVTQADYSADGQENISAESVNRIIKQFKAYERRLRMVDLALKRLNLQVVHSHQTEDQIVAIDKVERTTYDDDRGQVDEVDTEDTENNEITTHFKTKNDVSTKFRSLKTSTAFHDVTDKKRSDKNNDFPNIISANALKATHDSRKSFGLDSQQLRDRYSSLVDHKPDIRGTTGVNQQGRGGSQSTRRQNRGRLTPTSSRRASSSKHQIRPNGPSLMRQVIIHDDEDCGDENCNSDDYGDGDCGNDDCGDDDCGDDDCGSNDGDDDDDGEIENGDFNLQGGERSEHNYRSNGWMIRSNGNGIDQSSMKGNDYSGFQNMESVDGTQPEWRSAEWKAAYNMLVRRPNFDIRL